MAVAAKKYLSQTVLPHPNFSSDNDAHVVCY